AEIILACVSDNPDLAGRLDACAGRPAYAAIGSETKLAKFIDARRHRAGTRSEAVLSFFAQSPALTVEEFQNFVAYRSHVLLNLARRINRGIGAIVRWQIVLFVVRHSPNPSSSRLSFGPNDSEKNLPRSFSFTQPLSQYSWPSMSADPT